MPTPSSYLDDWITGSPKRSERAGKLKRLYSLQELFLYGSYQPVRADGRRQPASFLARINRWLDMFADDDERWDAFCSLEYFFYASQDEFEEMYRCAVQHRLLPWLAGQASLNLFSNSFNNDLELELKASWSCPISDSLLINQLLHITGLEGQNERPQWATFHTFPSDHAIQEYVRIKNIRRLILFEDFIGSGKTALRALNYAKKVFSGPILIIPLVICQDGKDQIDGLCSRSNGRIECRPVVVLGANCLLKEHVPAHTEPPLFNRLRGINLRLKAAGVFGRPAETDIFGKYGIGSLYSSYSNCPNTTPYIYHKPNKRNWPYPLFPRANRK